VRQGLDGGSIFKSGLTAIGNAGEPIRLDVYFTRTSMKDPSGVTVNANQPLIDGYSRATTPLPFPLLHPNNATTSGYSAATVSVADGASETSTFPGFAGLTWTAGNTTSFKINIDGAAVDVTGTYNGASWSFVPDDAGAIPDDVTISYSTAGGDLAVTVANATGVPITTSVNSFVSREYDNKIRTTFAGFGDYHWDDEDTVSYDLEIDGITHRLTGVYANEEWTFTPDDPATFPAGVDLSYDTSGSDLIINVVNNTGTAITAGLNDFTSTTTALDDKWEMTVYHQPNASAYSFPYSDRPLKTVSLEFDRATGSLSAGSPLSLELDLGDQNGGVVQVDLSGMRQLATDYTPLAAEMNGSRPSPIDRVVIDNDGIVSVQYANGAMTELYRLDLAYVQSPDRLTVLPGNVFQEGLSSGQVNFGKPNEISLGAIKSGALEASNVDIAEELTLMIEAQRNYTANSKVFQTGGDLMDVLVNLKR
jgi:flagellar hook-basal body protein